MQEMVDIAVLNSRINFDNSDVPFERRIILGDATETGLTRFAGRWLGTDYDEHVQTNPKVFESSSPILIQVTGPNMLNSTI